MPQISTILLHKSPPYKVKRPPLQPKLNFRNNNFPGELIFWTHSLLPLKKRNLKSWGSQFDGNGQSLIFANFERFLLVYNVTWCFFAANLIYESNKTLQKSIICSVCHKSFSLHSIFCQAKISKHSLIGIFLLAWHEKVFLFHSWSCRVLLSFLTLAVL